MLHMYIVLFCVTIFNSVWSDETQFLTMDRSSTEPLPHKVNMFNDVIIDTSCITPATFREKLAMSLELWKVSRYRGVWLTLTKHNFDLIGIAIDLGFELHHALNDSIVLTKWLPENEESSLPPYATHTAGATGLVFNEQGDVLTVVEKYGQKSKKLPGGGIKVNEDSVAAAIREVKEETGIETRFERMICILETHHNQDDIADITIVYQLSVIGGELSPQASEIIAAEWTPYAEIKTSSNRVVRNFLAAYEATPGPFAPHRVSSIPEESCDIVTYFAPQGALIS